MARVKAKRREIAPMKERLKQVLATVGLEEPAMRVKLSLQARGWFDWQPLVPEADFSACIASAIERLRGLEPTEPFGVYLEFGVSRGTSMACASQSLRAAGLNETRMIGFDSFEGMPPEAADEGWEGGQFHSTINATRSYLKSRGVDLDRVDLVKGWFKDTLTKERRAALGIGKASLIMIDCDIYSASKEALRFCEPHIDRHAVVLFDDWGWREEVGEIGQKEAFAEFLAEHRDISAEPMPSYLPQARVFLLRRHRGSQTWAQNAGRRTPPRR
jgi:O-methyltransferase